MGLGVGGVHKVLHGICAMAACVQEIRHLSCDVHIHIASPSRLLAGRLLTRMP